MWKMAKMNREFWISLVERRHTRWDKRTDLYKDKNLKDVVGKYVIH